jgi:hypothetical protein
VDLEFVRLLRVQRDIYRLPRGMERFREYLRTMVDAGSGDLELPLVAMNPMGKEHVPAMLDLLLNMGADDLGEAAVASAAPGLVDVPGRFRVGLVVADDLKGGWTNRWASEFGHRQGSPPLHKRGWAVGLLWTSEPEPTQAAVHEEVLTAIYRGPRTCSSTASPRPWSRCWRRRARPWRGPAAPRRRSNRTTWSTPGR